MSPVAVKICGITSIEDGLVAAAAGADALGFVFHAPSPRAVGVEQARTIAGALPPFVARVGVFVNTAPAEVRRIAERVGLDAVQLHGDEQAQDVGAYDRRVIKALRVRDRIDPAEIATFAGVGCAILLDSASAQAHGGTGAAFDWGLIAEVRAVIPYLILAGGLTVASVSDAVRSARPDAVDVSSGVELRPGRKDSEKVRAFVEAAKGAA